MEPQSIYPVVCFGEVLWDILPSGPLPGGAPMNVAYHLKKLGVNPALITKIGRDDYGKELVNILSSCGVSTAFFDVDENHATGMVYANMNDHHEVVYDIVYPAAWDFIEWKEEYRELMKQARYFVFGSLASRNKMSSDTLMQLLELAKIKVLDINLRPPHFHPAKVELLLQYADIVKMNEAELELITDWSGQFNSMEDRIKLVQDRFNIETIIVTKGGEGAVVNHRGILHEHPGFKVIVADTIGSGDAFLAGFLSQMDKGAPVSEALAFASAIGAFIATRPGACPPYEINQITELMHTSTRGNSTIVL
ncbi:MAG: carbohydrate kinase family protein [Flavisolibacter sp.]